MTKTQKEKENMRHLFIGGCANGKWLETHGLVYVQVPEPSDLEDCFANVQYYRRETFLIDKTEMFIYVEQNISTLEAFHMLLFHYKP